MSKPPKPPLGHAAPSRWTVYKERGWWKPSHPYYDGWAGPPGYITWREAMAHANSFADRERRRKRKRAA